MSESLRHQIEELSKELNHHSELYHIHGTPSIEDCVYDAKYRTLKELEALYGKDTASLNSPTTRVGESISSSEAGREKHAVTMLSLGNVFTTGELYQFTESLETGLGQRLDWVAEIKYDGVAINLRYLGHQLKSKTTRGDGYIGLSVRLCKNVTLLGIPDKLNVGKSKDIVHVRGELVMPYSAFKDANLQREKYGLEPFKHPRNAVVGILNNRNEDDPINYTLTFIPYDLIVIGDPLYFKTHLEKMNTLYLAGFTYVHVVPRIMVSEVNRLIDYYWRQHRRADTIDIPMDGVVIKLNDVVNQIRYGETHREPRWAVAFKYPATAAETIVEAVNWTVSRLGVLTPVARIKPVTVGGALISSVSLHNPKVLNDLGLRYQDTVTVVRSGEVIPKITGIVHSKRIEGSQSFTTPERCPSCNGELVHLKESYVFCKAHEDGTCREQMIAQLAYYVSSEVMDVKGLGEATLELLYDAGVVKYPSDLLTLSEHRNKLLTLPNFGEAKITAIFESIESTKYMDYAKFILSLGIPGIAKATSVNLAKQFPTIDQFMNASAAELIAVPGVGKTLAAAIVRYFKSEIKRRDVLRRIENGVHWKQTTGVKQPFQDTVWVFTGRLNTMKRKEAMVLVTSRGGEVRSMVGPQTNYLVIGNNPTLSKVNTYIGSKLKRLTEDEFIQMIKDA